jgi:integrase
MSDSPKQQPRRISKPKPPKPVVGSIKKRTMKRANGPSYVVYRARFVDPENPTARIEATFSQQRYGGIANAHDAAKDWLDKQRTGLRSGTWQDPRKPVEPAPGDVTVAVVAEQWAATWNLRPLAPKTQLGYRAILDSRVLPHWGDTPVNAITPALVQAWITELTATARKPPKGVKPPKKQTVVSPRTVGHAYNVLRVCLRHAVRQGYISANPCTSDGIELPSRRRGPGTRRKGAAATWAELRELCAALPEHYRTPVELAVLTGLRAQELWGLTRADWDAEAGTITIRQTLSDISGKHVAGLTKTEASERTLNVPASLHEALTACATAPGMMRRSIDGKQRGYPAIVTTDDGVELALVPDADDPRRLVFTLPAGQPVLHSNFYRRTFKPTVNKLWPEGHRLHGVQFRFHDLRHSHGTNVLYATNNPTEVMKRLGHSQLAITTDLYGRHADEARDRLLAASIDAAWKGDDLADRRRAKAVS